MTLDHRHPDCPGTWTPERTAWRCSACGAVVYRAADVDAAVATETRMGELLREITPPST